MVLTATPFATSSRTQIFQKVLVSIQLLTSSGAKNDSKVNDTPRRSLLKMARATASNPLVNDTERRLMLRLLIRMNLLSGTRKASPPATQFFGSGCTWGKHDSESVVGLKILEQLNRASGLSSSSPPAVSGTLPFPTDTEAELMRKVLRRLNQIIG